MVVLTKVQARMMRYVIEDYAQRLQWTWDEIQEEQGYDPCDDDLSVSLRALAKQVRGGRPLPLDCGKWQGEVIAACEGFLERATDQAGQALALELRALLSPEG
jgi:hypothetical protein